VAASRCAHSLCRQPESLVDPAQSAQFGQVQWAVVHQVLLSDQSPLPSSYASEAPPPVLVPLLDPLSVALRI
jgi:hypothetical protein